MTLPGVFTGSRFTLLTGDASARLLDVPHDSVGACITSPPYYAARAYLPPGHKDLGLELGRNQSLEDYLNALREVFCRVWPRLQSTGTLWIVIGDSYNGSGGSGGDYNEGGRRAGQSGYRGARVKGIGDKSLLGVPWRLALMLQAQGWILRRDIILYRPNRAGLDSAKDRPATTHEYLFMFSKGPKYWFHSIPEAAKSVWDLSRYPAGSVDHPAAMQPEVARRCVDMAIPIGGLVLDPFSGAGTVGAAALERNGRYLGIDLYDGFNEFVVPLLQGVVDRGPGRVKK